MKKILDNKTIRIIMTLLFTLFTLVALFLNLNIDIMKTNLNSNIIVISIMGVFLYLCYSKFYKKNESNKYFKILALIFGLLMIFGNSYKDFGNANLVFGSYQLFFISLISLIGYYLLFNLGITMLYKFLNKNKDIKESKLVKKFNQHPFIYSLIIMLVCWLPYIISFYPAILSPDPSNQIKQFFGLDTKYLDSVVLLDENVTITNHHPVIHTVMLGGSVKIGRIIFGSDNIGLFIYSIIQTLILASTLAYTIYYMHKLKSSNKLKILTLLIYSLVPVFPLYAMSAVKDTIFTCLVMLYGILVFDIIKNNKEMSIKKVLLAILLLIFTMLFRNNGIHMIVLSFPFLFLVARKLWKQILIILVVSLGVYKTYTKVLLPYLKITPGSIREVLSIPFQQTARYAVYYGDEETEDEIEAIDKILIYDTLKDRYESNISDPVKSEFNKYATNEDLKEYFKVWFNQLKKHPVVYVDATIENVYGYFYPDTTNWYIYHKYDARLKDSGEFDYHYNSLSGSRNVLSSYGRAFPYIPVLGLIVNIGFSVWIIMTLFAYLLYEHKYKYLIMLLPSIVLILVCVASPVNTYFRYAMPYVFYIPMLIGMYMNTKKERV